MTEGDLFRCCILLAHSVYSVASRGIVRCKCV